MSNIDARFQERKEEYRTVALRYVDEDTDDEYGQESAVVKARRFVENPDFSHEGIGRLDGHAWALILSARPDYEKYCPFDRFDAADWVTVLTSHPELAKNIRFHGVPLPDVDDFPEDFTSN